MPRRSVFGTSPWGTRYTLVFFPMKEQVQLKSIKLLSTSSYPIQDKYQDISLTHHPRKRFGQNFLRDPGVAQHIVNLVDPKAEEHLVEIGPGLGALTRHLLRRAGHLDVVELDRDLIEPLRAACANLGDLRIHNQDALRFDFCRLVPRGQQLRAIGNLPYNISTPLLFHLLSQSRCVRDMWFMLQKEVVDRIVAAPGSNNYGRLSVMVQYRCKTERVFEIGPEAFRPRPKVHSAIVHITPLPEPAVAVENERRFAEIVASAFSMRRKTLRNSLRDHLDRDQIHDAGVDPGARAQTVTLQQFASLANAVTPNSPRSALYP